MDRVRLGVSAAAVFVVAVWGASFVATRLALTSVTPTALVAIRCVTGAVMLILAARVRGVVLWPRGPERRSALLLGAILGVHLLIQAIGLQHTTAINTGWIIGFIPVVIAVGSVMFLRQRLPGAAWFGVSLGTLGVLLVIARTPPDFASARVGDALQIVSCFTWAAYTLIGAVSIRRSGSLAVTGRAMSVAAVILVIASAADGRITVAPPTAAVLVSVAFLGVICSGVGYLLWFWALDRIGAAATGAYLYLEPFFTLAVAWSLLGEPLTLNALAGGVLVLLGVALVDRSGGQPPAPGATTA